MTELLPCPFCGGEAQTLRSGTWWCVACKTPFCCDVGKFDTESEAIAAWNTRAERTCHVEYMPKNKELRMAPWIECSECGGELPVMITANYCQNCGAKVVGE